MVAPSFLLTPRSFADFDLAQVNENEAMVVFHNYPVVFYNFIIATEGPGLKHEGKMTMTTDRTPPMTDPDRTHDEEPLELAGLHIDVLAGTFSWYIRSLDSVVSRDLDHRMGHLDVAKGKGKITALLIVDRYPGVRPSQIAEVLMRDRPSTGRIIDTLVKAGDIRREAAEDDQRAQALFITEKGHELAEQVRGIIREQEDEFFDFIEPEDREAFMRMLKRAYLNMRKKLE